MKVRPIILCGGEGTRLWDNKKNIKPKQFINFGSWTLFDQTLKRVKSSLFDYPIISTNRSYEKKIKKTLTKIQRGEMNDPFGWLSPVIT